MLRKTLLPLLLLLILAGGAEAAKIEVSNGGLLGIPGSWYNSSINASYGDTIFIRVTDDNGTLLDYTILVNGASAGRTENSTLPYTITETGTITISSEPETTAVTIKVSEQEGIMIYIANYFAFVKTCLPTLTGDVLMDTVLWGFILFPLIVAVSLKVAVMLIRAVL